jgi:O-antigen ligase
LIIASSRAVPVARAAVVPMAVVNALVLTAIGWGALAFGGVYPWAYWPLAIVCQLCAFGALFAGGATRVPFVSRGLVLALAAVAAAGLLQVVPLPISLLAWIAPASAGFLANVDLAYGAGLTNYHAISLAPASTWTALALYTSFVLLLLGVARLLSLGGGRHLGEGLAIFAVILALVGIVQKPLYTGHIYGVWEPQTGGSPFGPFVNRNHFAGWMLMALPLVLALVCAGLERSTRGLKPGWRPRVLWLSTPEASRLILLAAGAAVMTLSLVMTLSRSGISALAVSLILTGWFVARGVPGRSRQAAGVAYLLVLAITVVGWVGSDTLLTRFFEADWSEFNGRRGAWSDAVGVASAFPLGGTGLNTYGEAARLYQTHNLGNHFGESHNDYLQLAAEGGLLLGLPVLACVALFFRDVWRRMDDDRSSTSWWLRRGAVTALIAIALQETVDFSLQIPGNAALFAVVCAVALHRRPASEPRVGPTPLRTDGTGTGRIDTMRAGRQSSVHRTTR